MSESTPTKAPFALWMPLSAAVLYLLDQVSKWWVVFNYKEPVRNFVMESTPVIEGSAVMNFNIARIHNTGVAFGMGNGTTWAPIVFLCVQFIALGALIYWRNYFSTKLMKLAWVGVMAGVVGNMTDRLMQGFWLKGAEKLGFLENLANGYVVDFLDVSFPWIKTEMYPMGYHWPTFNVADSCICVAACLFFIASFFEPKKNEPAS